MSDKKQFCPLFPDTPCPRGSEAAEECQVRVGGDYDPVRDFKDLLVMHCAIHRSQQAEDKQNTKK